MEPVLSDRQILAVGFVEFWSGDDMLGGGVARYYGGISAGVSIQALTWWHGVEVFTKYAAVIEGYLNPEM